MRRRAPYLISAFAFAAFLFAAVSAASWLARGSHSLKVVVLDKTVSQGEFREHGALFWLLQRYKINNGNRAYLRRRDFIGAPGARSGGLQTARLSSADLKDADFFYLADSYGISHPRGHAGGLNEAEARAILDFEAAGGVAILEFNAFDWPTPANVRRLFEERLGVETTCWKGRYYEDLSEIPRRYQDAHRAEQGRPWSRSGPGILMTCGIDRAFGLSIGEELGPHAMEIVNAAPGHRAMRGTDLSVPYYYWFEVLRKPADSKARVLARYRLDATEKGRKALEAEGLSESFPAVVEARSGGRLVYFAGDYSEASPPAVSAFIPGADALMERWAFFAPRPGHSRFFWGFYRPLTLNLLRDFGLDSLAVPARPRRGVDDSWWGRMPLVLKFLVALIWVLVFMLAASIFAIMILKAFRQAGDEWVAWRRKRYRPRIQDLLGGVEADYASVFMPRVWGDADAVEGLLLDVIQKVKGPMRDQIAGIFEATGLVERRVSDLRSWRAWRRAAAADRLGRMGSPRAVVPLLELLKDPEPSVRLVAVEAIGAVRDLGALPFLFERLEREAPHAKWRVARAIVGYGKGAVEELLRVLGDPGSKIHAYAASLLGEIRSQKARGALEALAADSKDGGARVAALNALGRLGDPRSLPVVVKKLAASAAEERKAAAEALGRLGDPAAVAPLRERLEDEDWWVRVKAAEALSELGEEGVKVLRGGLASESAEVRTIAREVLELVS